MEFIEKGEKAPCSGVLLNKTEHHCYSEFIKQLPEFKRYLMAQEEKKYNSWDWYELCWFWKTLYKKKTYTYTKKV